MSSVTLDHVRGALRRLGESWGCPVGLFERDGGFYWVAEYEVMCEPIADLGELLAHILEWDAILADTARAARINGASPTKSARRGRPIDPAVAARREHLIELVRAAQPATVRQTFYVASVRGIVPKTEDGYRRVQNDLVLLRREGRIPFGWITDGTRLMRKPRSFGSVEDALSDTARLYRKSLWQDAGCYVELWCEKDAATGTVFPVTSVYDVPLMVARGYASLSFLHAAAEAIAELDVPAFIYHIGDFDPSGQDAARAIEQSLREMAPEAEIHFQRLAVTPEQISAWHLPTRPTKASDSRSAKFGSDVSVELDAIAPDQLRDLVEVAILQHLSSRELDVLRAAEASERAILHDMIGRLRGGVAA